VIQKHVVKIELKEIDESGRFSGYGSVFGVLDQHADIIERGAFAESLEKHKQAGTMPKMLWQHNPAEIVGVWDEMREDEYGLYLSGKLIKTIQRGAEAHELLKAGALDALSIGFNLVESAPEGRMRRIKKVDLWEVSLVTWGANPKALVAAVKARESVRDFERFLREAGFSRAEAVRIASSGYKAIGQSESESVDDDLMQELVKLKNTMRTQSWNLKM
jgi:HK97 family phage prohead protease